MPAIEFANFVDLKQLQLLFRECKPRLLVVTDGSLNAGPGGFGLSQFVDVLEDTVIHGMKPTVVTRDRGANDSAFDDLVISRFDVVFLFGITGEGNPLTPDARNRISAFMQAGGGVFATGDHEDLGAGMCGQLPRVRHMRYWAAAETPDNADPTRLTTNLPGADNVFSFGDQSDSEPQRLYANYNIPPDTPVFAPFPLPPSSNVKQPHPLLRMQDGSALDVYPDHPHEGECRLPDDLSTMVEVDGDMVPEWPGATGFGFAVPAPRLVASTMSYGNGFNSFGGKSPVVPRAFIAIAAYNGQAAAANVGRVVTDATWHHYVNINFNGITGSDLDDIHRFWSNMANWLMPAKARRCLFPFFIARTLLENQVAEEIRIPARGSFKTPELIRLGAMIASALDAEPGSLGGDVLDDVALAITDTERVAEVLQDREGHGDLWDEPIRNISFAVLGAAVVEVARRGAAGKLGRDDKMFDASIRSSLDKAGEVLELEKAKLEKALQATELVGKILIG